MILAFPFLITGMTLFWVFVIVLVVVLIARAL